VGGEGTLLPWGPGGRGAKSKNIGRGSFTKRERRRGFSLNRLKGGGSTPRAGGIVGGAGRKTPVPESKSGGKKVTKKDNPTIYFASEVGEGKE